MKKVNSTRGFSRKSRLLAVVLVLSLVVGLFIGLDFGKSKAAKKETKQERVSREIRNLRDKYNKKKLSIDTSGDEKEVVRAIVQLKADALADKKDISEYTKVLKKEEDKILKAQDLTINEVEKITGNKVINQTACLVNSFSIDATRAQMKKIAKLDKVEKVYEAVTYHTMMSTAVVEGNVVNVWKDPKYGYTGEGVVVAVLDTGVNYQHQDMVLDNGIKTKYTKDEWQAKIDLLGYGRYLTEKVPFGYDYTEGKADPLSETQYHGYHVSSIISGNGKVTGVAKNAQIIGLKVLSDQGSGTSDDIIRGIEDAVKLGADIINMSLGHDSAVVSDEDYYEEAINNAAKNGVLTCSAAGNASTSDGNGQTSNRFKFTDTAMVGSPGLSESGIGVASANNITISNRNMANFSVEGLGKNIEYLNLIGNDFQYDNKDEVKIVDCGILVDKDDDYVIDKEVVKGNIALVKLGASTVNEKLYAASKAGAKGIILVNSSDDLKEMSVYDWDGVPVILVKKSDEDILGKFAEEEAVTTVKLVKELTKQQSNVKMSGFSSWGPTNELGIKPEITAPGGSIYAGTTGHNDYNTLSGTSMATPFTAGTASLVYNSVRVKHPELKGEELVNYIRQLLLNTANPVIDCSNYSKTDGVPYSVRYQGAGMVDAFGAVDNDVVVTYNGLAKVELGEVTKGQSFNITFTNYGKEAAEYTLSKSQVYTDVTKNDVMKTYYIQPVEGAKVVFSENTVSVPAGESVTVKATLVLPSTYKNNHFVEAFLSFKGNNVQDIGMPLLGFYGDWDAETIIDKSVYDEGQSNVNKINRYWDSQTALLNENGNVYGQSLREVTESNDVVEPEDENATEVAPEITQNMIKAGGKITLKVDGKYTVPIKKPSGTRTFVFSPGKTDYYSLCSIDEQDTFCTLYDEDGKYIAEDDDGQGEAVGIGFKLEYRLEKGKTYYYVANYYDKEQIGEFEVEFKRTDGTIYEELKEDIEGSFESIYNSSEKIELDKEVNVNLNADKEHKTFAFVPKEEANYTFSINANNYVGCQVYEKVDEFEWKELNMGNCTCETDEFTLEKKLKANKEYLFILQKNDADVEVTFKVLRTEGKNTIHEVEFALDKDASAFSPNGDGLNDVVHMSATQLRTANMVKVSVLNDQGKVIRVLDNIATASRLTYVDMYRGYLSNQLTNTVTGELVAWDGQIYNAKTGNYEVASDGQYYIQLESTVSKNGLPQVIKMPIKIDNQATKLKTELTKEEDGYYLSVAAVDNVAVADDFYVVSDYEDVIQRSFLASKQADGTYKIKLGKTIGDLIQVYVYDAAGNETVDEIGEAEIEKIDEQFEEELEDNGEDNDIENDPPVMTVSLDEKDYEACEYYESISKAAFLLSKKVSDKITLHINVKDDDMSKGRVVLEANDLDTFEMKNLGEATGIDGKYSITLNLKDIEPYMLNMYAIAEDSAGNVDVKNIALYTQENKRDFELEKEMQSSLTDINIYDYACISKDSLNEDGTYTVRGSFDIVPDLFKINGEKVIVDPKEKTFAHDIKMKPGKNLVELYLKSNGDVMFDGTIFNVFLNDTVLDLDLPEANEDGVIVTNNKTFTVKGNIKAYVDGYKIDINGNNVYSSIDYKVTNNGEYINREFSYDVQLEEGLNYIELRIIDELAGVVVRQIPVMLVL